MSEIMATASLVSCLFLLLAIGCPVTFAMLITSIIFGFFLMGSSYFFMISTSLYGAISSQILIAIPLFILMGNVLAYTGVAKNMFNTLHTWAGGLRGGLAMATEVICAIFGAMCGNSAAATITMGTIALPAMREHGYDKHLAIGSIASGGLLGLIIPPSVYAILYASITTLSIGKLYLAMLIPGLLLTSLYILYIGIRTWIQPELAPIIPKEERSSWHEKFVSLKGIIVPLLIVFTVLGGIYSGIVTPTEAATVGALSVLIVAIVDRSLTLKKFHLVITKTIGLTSMIVWMIMAITAFTNVFNLAGGYEVINIVVDMLPVSGIGVIIIMQLSIFIMGMVMDDMAIMFLSVPIFLPIIKSLGFDPLWFGVLFMVNVQCAWLTPPYGFNLFFMKSITPPDITMDVIYISVIPFIAMQLVCMAAIIIFPEIATWLPTLFFER